MAEGRHVDFLPCAVCFCIFGSRQSSTSAVSPSAVKIISRRMVTCVSMMLLVWLAARLAAAGRLAALLRVQRRAKPCDTVVGSASTPSGDYFCTIKLPGRISLLLLCIWDQCEQLLDVSWIVSVSISSSSLLACFSIYFLSTGKLAVDSFARAIIGWILLRWRLCLLSVFISIMIVNLRKRMRCKYQSMSCEMSSLLFCAPCPPHPHFCFAYAQVCLSSFYTLVQSVLFFQVIVFRIACCVPVFHASCFPFLWPSPRECCTARTPPPHPPLPHPSSLSL